MVGKRGAKAMFAKDHTIGAMGKAKPTGSGAKAKRGAKAMPGSPVAKAQGPKK